MARRFSGIPRPQVPPYLRLANVQFDIDAEKFYKLYIDLMTRPAHDIEASCEHVRSLGLTGARSTAMRRLGAKGS